MTILLAADRTAAVQAIRANLKRVMEGERRNVAELLRLLEDERVTLQALLATGTEFDQSFARRMTAELDRAMGEFRRSAQMPLATHFRTVLQESDDTVARLAKDALADRGVMVLPGIDPILVDFAAQNSALLVTRISAETRNAIDAIFARSAVGSSSVADVSRELTDILGPAGKTPQLIEATLRTETARLYSHAAAARIDRTERGAASAGLRTLKRWIATPGARTRPTHAALNGALIPNAESFNIGAFGAAAQVSYEEAGRLGLAQGTPAAMPLDAILPPEEVVHCRCTVVAVFEESAA